MAGRYKKKVWPGGRRVAERAMGLSGVVCRGLLEKMTGNPVAEGVHEQLRTWLVATNLKRSLEPWEDQVIFTPVGGLTPTDTAKMIAAADGLAMLAWTLNWREYPAHDKPVDPRQVTEGGSFLADDVRAKVIDPAKLRPLSERIACKELNAATHGRLVEHLKDGGRSTKAWLKPAWFPIFKMERENFAIDGDLVIGGVGVREADPKVLQTVAAALAERLRASLWLVGDKGKYWD